MKISVKKRTSRSLFLFLVPKVGRTPLAARPDKRLSIVWLAFVLTCNFAFFEPTICSRKFLHPQVPPIYVRAKKGTSRSLFLFLVPKVGLEPTRYRYHRILSPTRLPFHHFGVCNFQKLYHYKTYEEKKQAFLHAF